MNQICIQHPTQIIQGATKEEALESLNLLKRYICPSQYQAIVDGMAGEESQFFQEKLVELAATVRASPQLYEAEHQGKYALVYFHYFKANCDWYITELSIKNDQVLAFGVADMGYPEFGYISIDELRENNVELDLHWNLRPVMYVDKQWRRQ